ncbi:hypothetical protein L209DRAFT_765443 [Thermothelomyces heterothallicus CBS 203.75]
MYTPLPGPRAMMVYIGERWAAHHLHLRRQRPGASTSPSVFGCSSGGFFAFQFALDLPDMADHLIAHEAATVYETCGLEETGFPKTEPPESENVRNFWANEIPVLAACIPNLCRLKENKTNIGLMRRIRCREPFFARATIEQAKILDCPLHVVPGRIPPIFLDMVETLIRKRNGS